MTTMVEEKAPALACGAARGEPRGYHRHRRAEEEPCKDCKAAHSEAEHARPARRAEDRAASKTHTRLVGLCPDFNTVFAQERAKLPPAIRDTTSGWRKARSATVRELKKRHRSLYLRVLHEERIKADRYLVVAPDGR